MADEREAARKSASDRPAADEARLAPPDPRPQSPGHKPDWLRVRRAGGEDYHDVQRLLRRSRLHTICESGACPNRGECFNNRTATFMILGRACTRSCAFCNVDGGCPEPVDPDEPRRLAEAVAELKLRFVVVTSVTRDELPDGGAAQFAAVIREIRRRVPGCGVEVLIPDFLGDPQALEAVLAAGPDILDHNLETVPRLYAAVRPQADYRRSLLVLRRARQLFGAIAPTRVKTGIMLGLGETRAEVESLMADCVAQGVDILTIGQYLQPTPAHHPVERYWEPDEFRELARAGRALGLPWVEAGPLVRSSYHAREQADGLDAAGRA
jgi:lipoic acid synthetase